MAVAQEKPRSEDSFTTRKMSRNKTFGQVLNPEAPTFEVPETKSLMKIIENQNEDIFSLKSIYFEAQTEIVKKDEEIERLKAIIENQSF